MFKQKIYLIFLIGALMLSLTTDGFNKKYYTHINKANQDLYHTNYYKAKKNIEKAFGINNEPYYHDIYKLIYCNFKLNLSNENVPLLRQLVLKKRIHPKLLSHQLKGILKKNEIDNLLSLDYKEINSLYKTELIDLFDYDQKIRDYSECKSIEDSGPRNQCYKTKFAQRDSIDELNAKVFIDIIERFGMPSENELGTYLRGRSLSYNQLFYILGIHFLQTSSKDEVFNIYSTGLHQNKFHPELYAAVYDFMLDNEKVSFENKLLSTSVKIVDNKKYKPFIYYSETIMDSINNNRLNIGLDSFSLFQKQVMSDLLCSKAGEILPIISFPRFEEYPAGLIRAAFEKENMELNSYEIDSSLIYNECNCPNRVL